MSSGRGKGLSLDEFRESLKSDATEENAKLKDELEKLRKKNSKRIHELEEEVKELKGNCQALGNRCYVLTKGAMCVFCGVSSCPYALTMQDYDKMAKFVQDNHLPRDDESKMKAFEFIMKERAERFLRQAAERAMKEGGNKR